MAATEAVLENGVSVSFSSHGIQKFLFTYYIIPNVSLHVTVSCEIFNCFCSKKMFKRYGCLRVVDVMLHFNNIIYS